MLQSLLSTTPVDLNYEIILIDDGSTDGTLEWLHGLDSQNIHVIFNDSNLGYAKSNNKAVNIAKGEILGLLNNDLIMLDGWLEPMLHVLCHSSLEVGIVGNIQQRVIDNAIDHAGIDVNHLAQFDHIREISFNNTLFNRSFAVTGACCLLFKNDFLAVDGFDEQFINGGEDVDLCLKLRNQLNKQAYVANTSHVMHHVSLSRSPNSLNNEKNSQRLFSKWRPFIFQEVKNAWMHVLASPDSKESAIAERFSLNNACYGTPHIAAQMLADCGMIRQELWWQQLLDKSYPEIHRPVEMVEGFYWDNDHHYAYIASKAWLTLAKGLSARNVVLVAEIIPCHAYDLQILDALVLTVEVNGIQKQCWSNLTVGSFNLTIDNPVFSWKHPSIITITIDSNSPTSIPASFFQSIRFMHLSLDHEMVFSFSHTPIKT
jgi:GT2 family glycosyltransferase